jgi:mRNA interferase RelE/StbE
LKTAYKVEFRPGAVAELERIPEADQRRIVPRIEALAADPRPAGIKQLAKGIFRLRVGNYRVIYQVREESVLVLVLKVGHRKDVYRALSRLLAERRGA